MVRRAIAIPVLLVGVVVVAAVGMRVLTRASEVPESWAEFQGLSHEEKAALTAEQLRAILAQRDAAPDAEESSSVCDEFGAMSPECETYIGLLGSRELSDSPCNESDASPECLAYLRRPERNQSDRRATFR